MGIPLRNTTDTLSFPWPEEASAANLIFGSMGGTNWESPYCVPGAVTATTADLGTGTQVGLGSLVGLTILEKNYAAGYVWMGFPLNPNAGASGAPAAAQAYCYQGLSLIGDPDSQLVTPNSVTAQRAGFSTKNSDRNRSPAGRRPIIICSIRAPARSISPPSISAAFRRGPCKCSRRRRPGEAFRR